MRVSAPLRVTQTKKDVITAEILTASLQTDGAAPALPLAETQPSREIVPSVGLVGFAPMASTPSF